MIYIHPIGGLGNIMFHIASIWTLAKDNNDELALIDVERKIYSLIHETRINISHAEQFRYLYNRFPNINNKIFNKIEYPFGYLKLEFIDEIEYVGYFQSEKYFKHRRNEILELFKPTDEILYKIEKYSDLYNNISLHVRRNDYVKIYPEIHPPQTIDYYNKALSHLPSDLFVLVFSDDILWCEKNFIGDRFIFIKELDYIDLYLMTKMKYHIIANSSFSWWGAWMSESEKIIAPEKWLGNDENYSDVVPENWLKL